MPPLSPPVAGRPVIGVTTPFKGGDLAYLALSWAIWRSGGQARRIYPGPPVSMESLQGLVLGGGGNVHPQFYGQTVNDPPRRNPKTFALNPGATGAQMRALKPGDEGWYNLARDEMELEMLHQACARDMPILGICRGIQLLNVYHGGTLHQDVSQVFGKEAQKSTILPMRPLAIKAGSGLEALLESNRAQVNSFHSQAVAIPGPGVVVSAADRWGMVQGIEVPAMRFAMGTQWHPEYHAVRHGAAAHFSCTHRLCRTALTSGVFDFFPKGAVPFAGEDKSKRLMVCVRSC